MSLDPDTFFALFEHISNARDWPDSDRTMLLQCVLTGKAQEAYSALSAVASKVYETVKLAVLKVYELVPEAYCQRFRSGKKCENQTYNEFTRDPISQFNRWCAASEVDTFEDLCNLVILEQLKNSVPECVATFISEHKVKTPREAVVLADEYVLTHRSVFGTNGEVRRRNDTYLRQGKTKTVSEAVPPKSNYSGRSVVASSNTCRYCQATGHWKKKCTVLKAISQVKSAAMAAPAITSMESRELGQVQTHSGPVASRDHYSAFISDGWVSLVGSSVQVPIKILRDTAAFDSFILESVLPFSSKSDTGGCILTLGMGMTPFSVPLHQVSLSCGLVQGQVLVGVRPQLPVDGIHMIWGNELAGNKVWADGVPSVVKPLFLTVTAPSVRPLCSDDVFPACAVTHAASRDVPDVVQPECLELPDSLIVDQLLGSQTELKAEQRADSSLSELFGKVVPVSEVRNTAQCYFLLDALLVCK